MEKIRVSQKCYNTLKEMLETLETMKGETYEMKRPYYRELTGYVRVLCDMNHVVFPINKKISLDLFEVEAQIAGKKAEREIPRQKQIIKGESLSETTYFKLWILLREKLTRKVEEQKDDKYIPIKDGIYISLSEMAFLEAEALLGESINV